MRCIDLTGKRFGRLRVLQRQYLGITVRTDKPHWLCLCDCGNTKLVCGVELRKEDTRSCGCLRIKHGFSNSRELFRWKNMKQRCYNPSSKDYKYYGARGIKMCDSWRDSFEAFYQDMGPCPEGLTIERINNDGDYDPSNCRWATMLEQNRNKRRPVKVA